MTLTAYVVVGIAFFTLFLFRRKFREYQKSIVRQFFPFAVLVASVAGVAELWAAEQRGLGLCFGGGHWAAYLNRRACCRTESTSLRIYFITPLNPGKVQPSI